MSYTSKSHAPLQNSPAETVSTVGSDRLDPALATALAQGNPLALGAVAGILDNSFLASLMGRSMDELTERGERTSLTATAAERGDRVDNRTERSVVPDGEDMHVHGGLDPTSADHANHAFWRSVAVAAEGAGLTNASRHMNHYLDNTGAPLRLDMNNLEANAGCVRPNIEAVKGELIKSAIDDLWLVDEEKAHQWSMMPLVVPHDESYVRKSDSADWY